MRLQHFMQYQRKLLYLRSTRYSKLGADYELLSSVDAQRLAHKFFIRDWWATIHTRHLQQLQNNIKVLSNMEVLSQVLMIKCILIT